MLTRTTLVSTVLLALALTARPVAAAVTLPSTSALVAAATMAVGTVTPTPNRPPPAPICVFVAAVLWEVARKLTAPLLVIDWLLLLSWESASTLAAAWISESAMLTATPARPPTAMTSSWALA